MFTGIIKEVGKVKKITNDKNNARIFEIFSKKEIKGKKVGQSIAVNGVCTTITKKTKDGFSFYAMPETIEKTNLKFSKIKDLVNLESAMRASDFIDGHLVQGHVDTTAEILELKKIDNRTILKIKTPKIIERYLSLKGSISINGISLTISDIDESDFSVDLIPHTLKNTNLGNLKKSDKVNLEADMIAKYLDRLLEGKEKQAKYNYLKERNFI
ncbi:MAG: riboflavin synthase [Candidatus Gracilibacteria bacterium]|jgi:riboflavin synthase